MAIFFRVSGLCPVFSIPFWRFVFAGDRYGTGQGERFAGFKAESCQKKLVAGEGRRASSPLPALGRKRLITSPTPRLHVEQGQKGQNAKALPPDLSGEQGQKGQNSAGDYANAAGLTA